MGKKSPGKVQPPTVSFREVPAGRETLAAIAEDRLELLAPGVRHRTKTKHYGDRISNAPGALSPKAARAMDTAPEVSITLASPGRDTHAALHDEHRRELPAIEISTKSDEEADEDEFLDTLEVERLYMFTILAELEHFQSHAQRARLVERRLLRQMHGVALDDVTRIDVEEGVGAGCLAVRVYTRVLD